MSLLNFTKQFSVTLPGAMAMCLIGTTVFVIGYRCYVQPKLNRRERMQSEEFASFIYEKEMEKAHQSQKFGENY